MTFEQLHKHNQKLEAILEEKDIALEESQTTIEKTQAALNQSQTAIDKMQAQINQMQFQIDQMNRLLYGAKRERFIAKTDENQLTLPFEVEHEEAPEKEQAKRTSWTCSASFPFTGRRNYPGTRRRYFQHEVYW